MRYNGDRWRLSNITLIPALAITLLLLSVPTLSAQEIVDPRSGRLFLSVTDLTVQAGPVTLEVRRSLETGRGSPGLLGTRWRLNWESRLIQAGPLVLIEDAGMIVQFDSDGSSAGFRTASGDRLVFDKSGRATRTKPDGTKEIFDAQGRLVERDYRNGNRAIVQYGADGRLARIEGPHGSALRFTMDKAGRVTQIEASTTATVRYAYQGSELAEVQRPPAPPIRYSYFAGGRLSKIEDPLSGGVQFAYDFKGRVMSRRWAYGSKERYEYDDKASRLRYTDTVGAVTTTQWSKDGRRQEVTDPLGRKSVLESDATGRPISVTGSTGATSRLAYDALGRTVAVTNPLGQTTKLEYLGESSLIQAVTQPGGEQQVFEYDTRGNLTAVRVGSEMIATFTYHQDGSVATTSGRGKPKRTFTHYPDGRLKSMANALGEATQFEYDRRGNLIRENNPLGGTTIWAYDAQDRLLSRTDPAGGATRFEYDAKGRVSRLIDPSGGVTRFESDVRGRLVAEIGPTGLVTKYEHDAAGREVKVIQPGNRITTRRYDTLGNLTGLTDPLGRATQFDYDPLGRVARERRPTGLEIAYRYDGLGNLLGMEDSTGAKTALQRDASGLLTSSVNPLGAVTRYQYDPLGNLVTRTDPAGHLARYTYAQIGGLAGVRLPSGDEARYEYDAAGRLVGLRRLSGGMTRIAYDAMGNTTAVTDPLGNKRWQSYDLSGRLISATDAAGRATGYVYDRSGRLTEKQLHDGRKVTYEYDALGNRLKADDSAFPVLFRYDQEGRLVHIEYPAIKKSVRYAYDPSGLKTKLIDAEGREIRYEYTDKKQLSAIVLPDSKKLNLTHDAKDRLSSIRYPNGMTGQWEYDTAGRIIKISYRDRGGKVVAGFTYRYDPAGNPVERQDSQGRTVRFQHDSVGQLVEEVAPDRTIRFRYLSGGNRATVEEQGAPTQYRYDADDRLVQAGAEQFNHDKNGNLIERKGANGATIYEYDVEDQLVKVAGPEGGTTSFGYAPTGERVWKKDRQGLTHYLYDGFDLIQEFGDGGSLKATYVHGPGIDRPLAMLRDGKTYYYHVDRLGSVTHLTDEQGQVVTTYDYDPFGRMVQHEGTIANPFTFTGREFDGETGLYYYRARYYDPVLGRFLSPDPAAPRLRQPQTLNPYLYVRNNPLRYIDPMGLYEWPEAWVNFPDTAKKISILEDELNHPQDSLQEANARWIEEHVGPGSANKYRQSIADQAAADRVELARLRAQLEPSPTAEGAPPARAAGPTRQMPAQRPGQATRVVPRPESPVPETPGPEGAGGGISPRVVGLTAVLTAAQLYSCNQRGLSFTECAKEIGVGLVVGGAVAAVVGPIGALVLTTAGTLHTLRQATDESNQRWDAERAAQQAEQARAAQQQENLKKMEQVIAGLEAKIDGQITALRNRISAALARAEGAAQAAEQAGTTASNLLGQLKRLAGQIAKASDACKAVEQLTKDVQMKTDTVKKFAEQAEKGIEESWSKVKACQSTSEINKALWLANRAQPLAQALIQKYQQAEEALAKLDRIKALSEQARRSLGNGQGVLAQIRTEANSAADHLNEIRNQAELARSAFEGIMPLKATLLDNVNRIRAAFPADAVQVDQRLAPLVERLQAEELAPAFRQFIGKADLGRNRAYESLKFANELSAKPPSLCDAVSLPEGQVKEAARAIADMGLGGLGEGIEEQAKSCLTRLRPPPSITTGKGNKTPDGGDEGQTPPPLKRVLIRLGVFCSPSKIKVGQSASCRATGAYSDNDKSNVYVDLTGVATWSAGPTIIGDWPGSWRAMATHEGASGSATVTVIEDEKKGPTDVEGKRPPDIRGATEAGTEFGGGVPSRGPTSGAAGGGQPVEQPGLKPQPGVEPPTVGTGGPASPGAGQGVWCYYEKTQGMMMQYWLPAGPCPPIGRSPSDSRVPSQGLVPHDRGGGVGGGGSKGPTGGGTGGGTKPSMGKTPPTQPKPACGPATVCKCAGGKTGHIPCDKSKGSCHCGGS